MDRLILRNGQAIDGMIAENNPAGFVAVKQTALAAEVYVALDQIVIMLRGMNETRPESVDAVSESAAKND